MQGVLNFDLYSAVLMTDRSKELVFEIKLVGNDRVFAFMAPTKEKYDQWCSTI
jgi:hypothetical protein